MRTMEPEGPSRVRLRGTWAQWALPLLFMVLCSAGIELVLGMLEHRHAESARGLAFGAISSVAPMAIGWAAVIFWGGVTLTADALVVHRLDRRTIPWHEIRWITRQRLMGSWTILVLEKSGRQTRLAAPSDGFLFWDRNFEAKFHAIGDRYSASRALSRCE